MVKDTGKITKMAPLSALIKQAIGSPKEESVLYGRVWDIKVAKLAILLARNTMTAIRLGIRTTSTAELPIPISPAEAISRISDT